MKITRVKNDERQFILAVFNVKDLDPLIAVASEANVRALGANGRVYFTLTEEGFSMLARYNQDESFRQITIATTAYISENEPENWRFQSLSGTFTANQFIKFIKQSASNKDFLRNQGDEFCIGFSLDENDRHALIIDQKYDDDEYIPYELNEAIEEPPLWAEYDNAIEIPAANLLNLLSSISREYSQEFTHAILTNENGNATLTYRLGEDLKTLDIESHIEEFFDLPLTRPKLEQLEKSLSNDKGSLCIVELLNERIIGNNNFYHQLYIAQEVIDLAAGNIQEQDIIEERVVRFIVKSKSFKERINTTCTPYYATVHDVASLFIRDQGVLACISEVSGIQRGGSTPLLENVTFSKVICVFIKELDSALKYFKFKRPDNLIIDLCSVENNHYLLLNDSLLTKRNARRIDIELSDNRNALHVNHHSIHCPGNDSHAKQLMFKGGSGQQLGLLGDLDNECNDDGDA